MADNSNMEKIIETEDVSSILDRAHEIYQELDPILPFALWLEEQEYSAEVVEAAVMGIR